MNEAQATAMWGIGMEPLRHSEVVYGSAALRGATLKESESEGGQERGKMGTKRREGRGREWLCLRVSQPKNSAYCCAHSECRGCNSMQTVHGNQNNDFKICMGTKMNEYI